MKISIDKLASPPRLIYSYDGKRKHFFTLEEVYALHMALAEEIHVISGTDNCECICYKFGREAGLKAFPALAEGEGRAKDGPAS